MSNEGKKEDDRYEFNSVKLAHELMVDVLGALIPGALFLFCIILCIVFPIICYSTQKNNFGFLVKDGDWFWIVAFLSFLILSYVLGLLFYRADIKVPDRVDIRREQGKKLKAFIDGLPVNNKVRTVMSIDERTKFAAKRLRYAAILLDGEIQPLAEALNKRNNEENKRDKEDQDPYGNKFKECCDQVVKILNDVKSNPTKFVKAYNKNLLNSHSSSCEITTLENLRNNVLCVMFPESIKNLDKKDDCKFVEDEFESNFPNNTRKDHYHKIAQELFPEIGSIPFRSRGVLRNTVKIVPLVERHTGRVICRLWRRIRLRCRLYQINNNWYFENMRLWCRKHFTPGPYELFNMLMVSYLILHMQNESGCATERRCDFPYMSYYKYLLKRRQFSLLKYADWATSSARTKNQINKYKIDLQLHVPNAYAIIIKNESHVRMASSSWHVAKVIRFLSIVTLVITIFLSGMGLAYNVAIRKDGIKPENTKKESVPNFIVNYQEGESYSFRMEHQKGLKTELLSSNKNGMSNENINTKDLLNQKNDRSSEDKGDWEKPYVDFIDTAFPFIGYTKLPNDYLAILFPILTLALSWYILKNIPRFIHYQRLREIYYTLKVYKLWNDAKEEMKKLT